MNYIDCVPFSCNNSFHNCSKSSQLISKNLILEFPKYMSKHPLI